MLRKSNKIIMKDPAFLFYSKDFYEGTRLMLPEERACYVDLLIYQHQNEIIPLELKRVLLYCSGVDIATLEATLEAKFIKTDKGYYNERLKDEVLKRCSYKSNQSDNGKVGQFWKKAKAILNQSDFNKLNKCLSNNKVFVLEFTENNTIDINTLKGLLKQCLNNNVNEDVNVNVNEDKKEIEVQIEKSELEKSFEGLVESRKKKGKPMTERAKELVKNKVRELSKGDEQMAIKLLDQAVEKGWDTVWPLQENFKPKQDNKEKIQNVFQEAINERMNNLKNKVYGQ